MTDDQMAERRRASAAFYDSVAAATAAQPKAPTHITRTGVIDGGLSVTVDDGNGTAIAVTAPAPGRVAIGILVDGRTLVAEVPAFAATAIINALGAVAGITLDNAAPITGSR